MPPSAPSTPIWPLVLYFFAVLAVVAGMIGISFVLGQRHMERATGEPYESGIVPTGSAHLRVSVRFYLIAMFFVVFDVESVFLFAWAIAFRQVGWAGYIEAAIFIVVLLATLAYLWREGALLLTQATTKGAHPKPIVKEIARS